jgi:hypothetical protein
VGEIFGDEIMTAGLIATLRRNDREIGEEGLITAGVAGQQERSPPNTEEGRVASALLQANDGRDQFVGQETVACQTVPVSDPVVASKISKPPDTARP